MSATTAMPGEYPIRETYPTIWPSVSTGGYNNLNVYSWPWTPTKAEFDALKADVAAIKATLERAFGQPEPRHEPLRTDDV